MVYAIEQGIQVSLNGSSWQKLTDHNRSSIEVTFDVIEKSNRMANGTMRKYVVAKKANIRTSWRMIPSKSGSGHTVDDGLSAAWLESFYIANSGAPMFVKVVAAKEDVPTIGSYPSETGKTSLNSSVIYSVFITNFSKTVVGRTSIGDMVDIEVEFKEI